MLERFKNVEEAINEIRLGGMIIVTDDEDRENEGDLIMAGELVTPESVNFMAKEARGLICAPISEEYALRLGLTPMTEEEDKQGTAFTLSCDLKHGTTTGISAADRAKTIKALSDPSSKKDDFNRPGHIFPLIAREGGVLKREGHTEAAIDLAVFAGLNPCGVICEIINDDGTMARGDDLDLFKSKHKLKSLTIKELREYKEYLYYHKPVLIPTKGGDLFIEAIDNPKAPQMPHLLLYYSELSSPLNLRMHSECLTGDLLGSRRCDCGEQLDSALDYIRREGGAVIYLRQEGRGIGLINKLRAYHLQDLGFDTLDANLRLGFKDDERSYDFVADLLQEKGVSKVNLLTNNPLKVKGLEDVGIEVVKRISLEVESCKTNREYLNTKKNRMGHILEGV